MEPKVKQKGTKIDGNGNQSPFREHPACFSHTGLPTSPRVSPQPLSWCTKQARVVCCIGRIDRNMHATAIQHVLCGQQKTWNKGTFIFRGTFGLAQQSSTAGTGSL